MTDDILSRRDLRPIAELAARLPDPPSAATLWRWHAIGIDGIRLRTIRIGGRRYSTAAAFNEFVQALSALPTQGDRVAPTDANAKREGQQ